MKNYINILLDAEFNLHLPFECNDFSSRCIFSMMYEPLFNKNNAIYTTSSYVRNHYFNIEDFSITFEFVDEIFFSNGEKLTSTDIYKTLYYQISHKTMFSSYLDFIEGVSEFLYDGKLNVEFGIYDIPERNMLVIKCNRKVDYCDIFSNIEFSPVYFDDNGKPDIYISNGQFNLFVVKDYLVTLKRNKYVSSITNKNIMFVRFIVNNNLYYPIKLFHDGYIDVTSCTYFPNELVKYENIACKDSSIYFLLGFKEEFIQFKSIFFDIINNYINNNLSDILSPVRGYFLDNEIIYDFRAKKINKINFKKLKIAYLDYYPNKNIICVLSEYLLSMGFEVELYGFDIKSYCNLDKSIYDIYLTLSVMLTESKYDLSIYYISYLLDKDIDGFLDIINSDNSNEDYKKQSEYLLSHALCLPICRGKFIYLKSKYADNFHVNDKGLFNL